MTQEISCQISILPFADDYRRLILELLKEFDPAPLRLESGTMSSTLIGPAPLVWEKVRELYDLAERLGVPFKLDLGFSTGCL